MMPFLKSILSPKGKSKETVKKLQEELELSSRRVSDLEDQVESLTNCVHELSQCVKDMAYRTSSLTAEVLSITDLLRQASNEIQKNEKDIFRWRDDKDGDGYLN